LALSWIIGTGVAEKTVGIVHNGLVFGEFSGEPCSYHDNWRQGGRLIDTHEVWFEPHGSQVKAWIGDQSCYALGATRLEAGLRVIALMSLGEMVMVPAALLPEELA
jgi:hypothetical protein